MRIITEKSISAFLANHAFRNANMTVEVGPMGATLKLHGNAIAVNCSGVLQISTAGWNTNTTRARLNGLPGVSVYTRKGVLYLNGKEWDGGWTTICTGAVV